MASPRSGSGSTSTLQVGANVPDTLALDFVRLASDQLGNSAFKLGGATGLITTLTNIAASLAAIGEKRKAVPYQQRIKKLEKEIRADAKRAKDAARQLRRQMR